MEQQAGQHAPPPASEECIRSLPKIVIQKDALEHPECAICQEEYTEGEQGTELPCKHVFHPDCITKWLQMHGTKKKG